MSNRYKGGVISATPPTTTGGDDGVASGAWTLEQQMQAQAAGLWPSQPVFYIENMFSTYLYTGNGSTQTINNGVDLAGKGGLVWTKGRNAADDHKLYDTERGATKYLMSSATNAQTTVATSLTAFNSNGFSLGSDSASNFNTRIYASWTFRKQPKFFDVVTYTGDGSDARVVAHNLGSVPATIIIKSSSQSNNWTVWHRSTVGSAGVPNSELTAGLKVSNGLLSLNTTSAVFSLDNSIKAPDINNLYLGDRANTDSDVNMSGVTYVAYLFAHDAGGFGLTGTDNVISCGSYVGNGSATGPVIDLGWEPQFVIAKGATVADNWFMYDTMRGFPTSGALELRPNETDVEAARSYMAPTSTGFKLIDSNGQANGSGETYIYIAIRRGPMKVPTTGTSVFAPIAADAPTGTVQTTGFPVSLQIQAWRGGAHNTRVIDRLRGVNTTSTESNSPFVNTDETAAESTAVPTITRSWDNTGFAVPSGNNSIPMIWWNFQRAPGFFDEVCYTGNFTNRTIAHNLAAVPELMIIKNRSAADRWSVYSVTVGPTGLLVLNTTAAADTAPGREAYWNGTAPTASVFSVGQDGDVNNSGANYVNYLFASAPGVSKVGSYTGTGAAQTINCGFTGGARFVLIKRTDSTGDWYVWDSARGIVAGDDPYLLLNSTAAEVTNTDYIDTAATGFEITSTAPDAINASGGTFVFLAIA
jgi:hypothetical protein